MALIARPPGGQATCSTRDRIEPHPAMRAAQLREQRDEGESAAPSPIGLIGGIAEQMLFLGLGAVQ